MQSPRRLAVSEAGMPLPNYGVLIGTLDHFSRDDPDNFGSWYHGHVWVNAPGGIYRCAVDVKSQFNVPVEYRLVHGIAAQSFNVIASRPNGYHELAPTSTSGALDYIRS